LEALVLESRGIRAHRPPWNVQIDVHEPEQLPPDWWWPLFYLAPGEDPARVTAVFLYGAEEGWLLHLPREEQAAPIAPLVRWLESEFFAAASPRGGAGVPMGATPVPEDQSRVTGPPGVCESAGEESMHPAPPPDAIRLDIPEARLALRFFRREEEQCIRLEPIRYRDIEELTRAALRAAREG
jgi:hypothetical protein